MSDPEPKDVTLTTLHEDLKDGLDVRLREQHLELQQALRGMATLEILGLVFNPFNRTLQPMRMHFM